MIFSEAAFEDAIIELFENMGYTHIYAPDMDRNYTSPLLDDELRDSLARLNKPLPSDAIEEAISKLKKLRQRQPCAEKHGLYGLSAKRYYGKVF